MTSYDGDGPVDAKSGPQEASPSGPAEKKKRRRRRKRQRGNAHAPSSKTTAEASQSQSDAQPQSADERPRKSHKRHSNKPNHKHHRHHATKFRDRPAYAALDLGTNNCRLLVAVPNGTSFRVVDAFSRIVRLGEGMANTGRLSDEAMDRAVEALKVCAQKLKGRNIKRVRLIATEACRIAENGEEFIERVRDEAGLDLEIVNRETEARLAVAGCSPLVDHRCDGAIIFDIGGGSSELVWLDLKHDDLAQTHISKRIRKWTSLPVGVVNISERHGGVDVTPDSFEGMIEEVMALLDDFPDVEALTEMVAKGNMHMLGTSGTVTTLAGVHLGLEFYDRRKVDGLWMSSGEVDAMTQKLLHMPYAERSENACIGKERADLVLAGCAILEALRRKWPCDRMRVADRGLREGILYELMNEDGVLRNGRSASRSSKQSKRRRHRRNKQRKANHGQNTQPRNNAS